jgi:hypothetical protein
LTWFLLTCYYISLWLEKNKVDSYFF